MTSPLPPRPPLQEKRATIYRATDFMGNVVRYEVRAVAWQEIPYAQHANAIHVRFLRPRERSEREYVEDFQPSTLILEGWGHPTPDEMYGDPRVSSSGAVVSEGRYASHDSGWRRDFDAMIATHVALTDATVLADFRKHVVVGKEARRQQG